jgi:septal ring factor EnvC (AmiA/AmiB activator)
VDVLLRRDKLLAKRNSHVKRIDCLRRKVAESEADLKDLDRKVANYDKQLEGLYG